MLVGCSRAPSLRTSVSIHAQKNDEVTLECQFVSFPNSVTGSEAAPRRIRRWSHRRLKGEVVPVPTFTRRML